MNLFQKFFGNSRIENKILKSKKLNYYLNLESSRFQFFIPRIPTASLVDLVFHTGEFGDFQITRVAPVEKGIDVSSAEKLAEIAIGYVTNEHKNNNDEYIFSLLEPLVKDKAFLGVIVYGEMIQKNKEKFKTMNIFIPMTAKAKNDVILMLDSRIPINAPEELLEDIKNIYISIKFTQQN